MYYPGLPHVLSRTATCIIQDCHMYYPGLPHILFGDVHMHTQPHTQRFPEPDTKSAGTETSQVLNMKVCGL